MGDVLQRSDWFGEPAALGRAFTLHKQRCGRSLEAVCRLVSHQLGWELQLEINGDLQRSEVCRSADEVLTVSEKWKAAMCEKGWS